MVTSFRTRSKGHRHRINISEIFCGKFGVCNLTNKNALLTSYCLLKEKTNKKKVNPKAKSIKLTLGIPSS